jgi:beta-lactamase regulating signal transducer with metallopeptidase domain
MTALLDHLWQSSLFALAAGLLTLVFRAHAARVRFWLWFAASLKFLVPFAVLVLLGERLARLVPAPLPPALLVLVLAPAAERFSAPAHALAPAEGAGLALPLALIWLAGFCAILGTALVRWLRLRALVRGARALPLSAPMSAPVEVRASQSLLEPGLVGIFRPVVLLPQDLLATLSPAELNGILAHEIAHFRRRDNLTAILHMAVEALFWFWLPVWLIGARLIAERERACDEGVITAGHDPEAYAGGILKVCRYCIRSPLACAAGASGANLTSRIRQIMSEQEAVRLDDGRRALLAGAAMLTLALPVAAGLVTTPLAITVKQHVAAVQTRAQEAVAAVAAQIGMAPVTVKAEPVRRLPRMKIAAVPPAIAVPAADPVVPVALAPADAFSPAPPSQVAAAAPANGMAPARTPAQTSAQTSVREAVLALDPRGEGDPDAVTCRAPQVLPGSRLPGPEVCETNRFWASLYAGGRRLSPDGRTLIASTERFGEESRLCPAALAQGTTGLWITNTTLAACR